MGPDLSLMASTPAPGEAGGEELKLGAVEQPQSTSPLKAVGVVKSRPTSASSAKSPPKSPLSVASASRSEARAKPKDVKDTASTSLTYTSLNSRSSFPATDTGAPLTRSNSQASNTTEASDGTVIVHKEGSGAFPGSDREHARRAMRDAAKLAAAQPVHPTANNAAGRGGAGAADAPLASHAQHPSGEGSPRSRGLASCDGNTVSSSGGASGGVASHVISAGEQSPGQSSSADVPEQPGSSTAVAMDSSRSVPYAAQFTESSSIGGSSISASMGHDPGKDFSIGGSGRRMGSFSGFPEASGLSQGTPVAQYPDVGWMRTSHSTDVHADVPQFMTHKQVGPSVVSSPTAGSTEVSASAPILQGSSGETACYAAEGSSQGDRTPPSPATPVRRPALPQHISLSSAFASGGRQSSEIGGSALPVVNGQVQPPGESPFAAEARQGDAVSSSAGLLAHGAPRVSAGTEITQALSSRSSNPMSARPAGSVNGDGQESGSPSLRRSMSTGDEHELREAMLPSLLQCGIKESEMNWFMSRFNKDREIDRTYTEDRILEGLSGWHTHLAGDEANSSARPNPAREAISPLSSLTAHLPSRNQVLGKSASQARSGMAGPSFGPSPATSAALQLQVDGSVESTAGPGTGKGSAVADADEAEWASADPLSTAPGSAQESKATPSEASTKAEATPGPSGGSREPTQAASQVNLATPFSSVPSLRNSQSQLPDTAVGPLSRSVGTASLPATTSLPSKGIREGIRDVRDGIERGIQGIHSRAASIVGPPSAPGPSSLFVTDVKFRVLGPGIAGAVPPMQVPRCCVTVLFSSLRVGRDANNHSYADMNIPIFIEEPTTAAAFFLSTEEYHEQLARIREDFFASTPPGHSAHPSEHYTGPAHTHTSSRSDAQGATPRSTAGEGGTPLVGSPTQSHITDGGPEGLGGHLDSASQQDPHYAYHDDSLSATGSIPTAPSPSYTITERQQVRPHSPCAVLLQEKQLSCTWQASRGRCQAALMCSCLHSGTRHVLHFLRFVQRATHTI